MTQIKEFGEITRMPYEIQEIEWRIHAFCTIAEEADNFIASSTFSVADVLWHLRLWPRKEQMRLYLACDAYRENSNHYLASDAHRDCSIKYDLGLKRIDDSVEYLLSGTIKKNEARNYKGMFITKTQLLERNSDLVSGNVLTIVCTMKWMTDVSQISAQPAAVLDKTKPLKLIRLDKLSENFEDFLGHKETCDMTLKVKDKEFKAHSSVLMARSSVFAANFKHDTLERQTGAITIPDCDPESFQEFLGYLYSGKLEELSFRSALNLYYTSDKYDVEELKAFCVEYLMQCMTVENVCDIAVLAEKYDEMQLISTVQDFFNKHSCKIFLTSEWNNLLKNDYRVVRKLLAELAKIKLEE